MGLDEFGREVPGMPSNVSSFGETSGLNFRYNDDEDDYHDVKRGRFHANIRDSMELDRVEAAELRGDNGNLNDHETIRLKSSARNQYDDHREYQHQRSRGGDFYHSRRSHRSNSPDSTRYDSMHHKKKHHMSYLSASERRKSHPSQAYTDGPLLCQFIWDKERSQLKVENQQVHESSQQVVADPNSNQDETHTIKEQDVNSVSNRESLSPKLESQSKDIDDDSKKTDDDADQEYMMYNKKYCLKYIRHFFNQHLDDMWFRQRYSPLEYRKSVATERQRARIEAAEFIKEVDASLEKLNGVNDNEPMESKSMLSNSMPSFVMNARLGGGVKLLSANETTDSSTPSRKRKYSMSTDHLQYDAIQDSGIPKSHLFSFLQNDSALYIMDVPSFVSDAHLYDALKEHSENDSFQIISEPVIGGACTSVDRSGIEFADLLKPGGTSNKKRRGRYLDRSAWAIFQTSQEKEKVLESLLKYQRHHSIHHKHDHDDERDNLQSNSFKYPKVLELEVDCSDPFGRTELDLDGKGGLSTESKEGGNNEAAYIIPIRHVSVFISSSAAVQTQSLAVLSAAISSKSRYCQDRKAAVEIAKRLDIARGIPVHSRLITALSKLFGVDILNKLQSGDNSIESNDTESQTDMFQLAQDVLDVSIAYLRRVHLFSFYNGCIASETIGCTLSGTHPTSTVHLRLQDADVILQKAKEDNAEMYGNLSVDSSVKASTCDTNEPKDMLVMRLDISISKAMEVLSAVDESEFTSPFVVNEVIDPLASEIESMEEKKKTRWLQDHSLIDEDQRARCSFHFCRKLFKDAAFLTKHLLKKHKEHLHAEMAKLHDQYMMGWWEEEEKRPVPPVLVDCGPKFGLIECNLQNGKEPFVVDPEPDLWRQEQERSQKKDEEGSKYRESNSSMVNVERDQKYKDSRGVQTEESVRNDNFVDVDDMKDEKIELNFENIQPSKKKSKKKKKKLL